MIINRYFVKRILGIDYGERFIGLALTDMTRTISSPYKTIDRKAEKNICDTFQAIIDKESVGEIVIGFPTNMNGTYGKSCELVEKFIVTLRRFKLPIHKWDERMSTMLSNRVMLEADLSRAKRKEKIDKMAACFILQNYLDHLRMAECSTSL